MRRNFLPLLFLVGGCLPPLKAAEYAIVVSKETRADAGWTRVVEALAKKYDEIIIEVTDLKDALPPLQKHHPHHTCFVATPEEATREFVAAVHQIARRIDADPYTDTQWAILTGYNASNALTIAETEKPLVVQKVGSGTEFATEMVDQGVWYCELVQRRMVKKQPGKAAEQKEGPADTTAALVGLLNQWKADCFITSGHATERDWQIGFRYRNGYFKCADGQLYGQDMNGRKHPIHSPNPKVYLPIGNCLMGHIDTRDAMALAWMNSAGVRQMVGYTVPTWFGYGGWGCLDYFLEQPGRYSFVEAFHANHHALIHELETLPSKGLRFDRDVVALYGDPGWPAHMAKKTCAWDQTLEEKDGEYTLRIRPNRGADSFKPVNTNGAQRGWRPVVQFLPTRIGEVELLEGQDLKPVITDDFILVPNPRTCDPEKDLVIRFRAQLPENFPSRSR